MLSRAKRLVGTTAVQPFDWGTGTSAAPPARGTVRHVEIPHGTVTQSVPAQDAIERDAFLNGYAQGEKAGNEAAAKRNEGLLRRLSETIDELTSLRAEVLRRTETQMVQLALAIARRVVQREISIDRAVLVGMARVALDRLAEHASATVRLHPDDHAATVGVSGGVADPFVTIVADPRVKRGSCLVQSDFGFMDLSPEAQFEELARTLLEDSTSVEVPAVLKASHGVVTG